jgi:DNA-binding transcriptional MerR regulator
MPTSSDRIPSKNSPREGLLKISDLSRESGVPVATIKFYLREGLLPAPTLKTGRSMAWYDRTFVDRIRFIKELQTKRFLPLDVIRRIVDQNRRDVGPQELDALLSLEGKVYEAIHYNPEARPLSRAEVRARYGIADEELNVSVSLGVLSPVDRDGVEYFEGNDLALLDTFRSMKQCGLTSELIPAETSLPVYVDSVMQLVRNELGIFTSAIRDSEDPAQIAEMAASAMKLSEQFIVLLRRKLLVVATQELRAEREAGEIRSKAVGA